MLKKHTAPKYLPAAVAKQWTDKYDAELKTATTDFPDDEGAQFAAAHKAANKLLRIEAPADAKALLAMPDWQVKKRGTTNVEGEEHVYVITIDGQKHTHPAPKKQTAAEKKAEEEAAKKAAEEEAARKKAEEEAAKKAGK